MMAEVQSNSREIVDVKKTLEEINNLLRSQNQSLIHNRNRNQNRSLNRRENRNTINNASNENEKSDESEGFDTVEEEDEDTNRTQRSSIETQLKTTRTSTVTQSSPEKRIENRQYDTRSVRINEMIGYSDDNNRETSQQNNNFQQINDSSRELSATEQALLTLSKVIEDQNKQKISNVKSDAIKTFDMMSNANKWIENFERIAIFSQWPEDKWKSIVGRHISEFHSEKFKELYDECGNCGWKLFKREFIKHFSNEYQKAVYGIKDLNQRLR